LQHNNRTERKNGSRENPTKLVGRDYPSAPRLRGKAGKKKKTSESSTRKYTRKEEHLRRPMATLDDDDRITSLAQVQQSLQTQTHETKESFKP